MLLRYALDLDLLPTQSLHNPTCPKHCPAPILPAHQVFEERLPVYQVVTNYSGPNMLRDS